LIEYGTNSNVKDELDGILDGTRLPIAGLSKLGAVKLNSESSVTIDANGNIDAFGKRANLSVSSLDDIPINSAGFVTYTGSSPSSKTGAYICLAIKGTNLNRAVYIIEENERGMLFWGNTTRKTQRIYVSYGQEHTSSISWCDWIAVDNYVLDISSAKTYSLNSTISSYYKTTYNSSTFEWTDWNGVSLDNTNGVIRTSLDGEDVVASYFNVSYGRDMIGVANNYKTAYSRFPLTIAAFGKIGTGSHATDFRYDEILDGLYYNRGTTNHRTERWIKLLDSENYTDYIGDTSNLYNTENYTTTEIDDAIQATLNELAA